jgi:4a-hydroxytetrahydrobiopterin dehydratase
MTKKLSKEEVVSATDSLPGVRIVSETDPNRLELKSTFKNFAEALAFTNHVGLVAEEMNHHPDIQLSWGKVVISIFTHSEGGITELDLEFMRRITNDRGALE